MIAQRQDEKSSYDQGLFRRWPVAAETWMRFGAAYVVLALSGIGLGILVTGPLANTALGGFDTEVSKWFEANRAPVWDEASRIADSLADTFHVIAIIVVLATAFAWVWRRWRESLILAFGLTLEALVFLTISLTVGRDRPPVEQMDISPATASFPSGHTGAAFTLYGILALIVFWNTDRALPRVLAVLVAVVAPVAVAVARLYRGMHYLTDIVVGAGLGIACIYIAVRLVDRAIEQNQTGGAT